MEFYSHPQTIDRLDIYCKVCKKKASTAYKRTKKGKESSHKCYLKYKQTDKYREVSRKSANKYAKTKNGDMKRRQYRKSEAGKRSNKKYSQTDAGRAASRRASSKRYYADLEHSRMKMRARARGCKLDVIEEIFFRDRMCLECFTRDNLTIDHIIPVSRGGKSVYENLQILCGPCNSSKGNRVT